jgi:hypothetical protein
MISDNVQADNLSTLSTLAHKETESVFNEEISKFPTTSNKDQDHPFEKPRAPTPIPRRDFDLSDMDNTTNYDDNNYVVLPSAPPMPQSYSAKQYVLQPKFANMRLPTYDNKDVQRWLSYYDQVSKANHYTDKDKFDRLIESFEQTPYMEYFLDLIELNDVNNWESAKVALMRRHISGESFANLDEILNDSQRQGETVEEYMTRKEAKINKIKEEMNISERMKAYYISKDLDPRIERKIKKDNKISNSDDLWRSAVELQQTYKTENKKLPDKSSKKVEFEESNEQRGRRKYSESNRERFPDGRRLDSLNRRVDDLTQLTQQLSSLNVGQPVPQNDILYDFRQRPQTFQNNYGYNQRPRGRSPRQFRPNYQNNSNQFYPPYPGFYGFPQQYPSFQTPNMQGVQQTQTPAIEAKPPETDTTNVKRNTSGSIQCYGCQKWGHMARECPQRQGNNTQPKNFTRQTQ